MSDLRICEEHGPFGGGRCPRCDTAGTRLLESRRRTRLSKFLSGTLRHFPDDVGLTLDDAGWADWSTVVNRTSEKYDWVDEATVEAVVQTDPKGRFEVDGDRIRAAYGHSVPVDLESGDTPVPAVLYHGTAPDAVPSILEDGLQPMARQHVHLSGSVDASHEVGSRHAAGPVVLRIDTEAMVDDGRSITKRGRDVYTTDHVPPAYISRYD